MESLFRAEALAYARSKPLGSIVLSRSPVHRALTWSVVAIMALLLAFLASASFSRKAELQGLLVPVQGWVRVVAPKAGVIRERLVQDGQIVAAGDVLFVLADEQYGVAQEGTTERIVELLKQRLQVLIDDRRRAADLLSRRLEMGRRRADELRSERLHISRQNELQTRRVHLAEQELARLEALQSNGYVSAAQVQARRDSVLDQQQRVTDYERSQLNLSRELDALAQEAGQLRVDAQRADEDALRERVAIEQQLIQHQSSARFELRAPQAGVVTGLTADLSHAVTAGQQLVLIVPAGGRLEAELYAPSSSIGLLRPGMPVMLRYAAFPYQQFGQAHGQVREVATASLRPSELDLTMAAGEDGDTSRFFRVRVTLKSESMMANGEAIALRPGAAVRASVLLERRRLYEWLFEPLYSLRGRI